MTDTYVEKLIIERLLLLEDLAATPKCIKYYNENKESSTPLDGFVYFMPDYSTVDTTKTEKEIAAQKETIDGPKIQELITWYKETYPSLYKTEDGNIDDDTLYDAIKSIVLNPDTDLTSIRRTIKLYDKNGNLNEVPLYPNVAFENEDFVRPVDENGNNTSWYEFYFIPAKPNQIELGTTGRSRWFGIMQVNICLPKTWGRQELNARYDEIATLFRSGLILKGVRIVRTYRSSALDDDDYYCQPVTIEWQADLDR